MYVLYVCIHMCRVYIEYACRLDTHAECICNTICYCMFGYDLLLYIWIYYYYINKLYSVLYVCLVCVHTHVQSVYLIKSVNLIRV